MEASMPISRAERAGITEMRRLLAGLRKRGDEDCILSWHWRGARLESLRIDKYTVLVGVEE